MKKFVGWQTTDGEVFVSQSEAQQHQTALDILKALAPLMATGERALAVELSKRLAAQGYRLVNDCPNAEVA